MTLLQQAPQSIGGLLRSLLEHPVLLFAAIALLGSAFKAITAKRSAPQQQPPPDRRDDESDLEARVRRNFEEMMRRRSIAPPSQPAETTVATPRPLAAPPRAAAEGEARRPVVDYDARVRPEPTSTEGPRAPRVIVKKVAKEARAEGPVGPRSRHLEAAAKAVAGNVRSGATARFAKRARALGLRRDALERRTLRNAVLMREILDPPVGLR